MRNLLFKLIFINALIFSCQVMFAGHITVSGEVSGEWDTDTVLVTGDLIVPEGESLAILPGTLVLFQGSFAMHVDGPVNAAGNLADQIYFRTADTSGFTVDTIPDGGWQGIRFDHNRITNDSSVFYYCNFSYGKMVSDDPLNGHGGAIYVDGFNKIRISQCDFSNNFATYNGGAIYLDSADIIIHHSVFMHNRCGLAVAPWGYGGAICSDNSNPDIRWNVFSENSSTGVGGGLAVRFEDCNVYNNIFTGNLSGLGGALGVLHIPEINYRINTNFFTENTALYFGGGVASINASPIYINNTIANNSAAYGGGFYCKDSISPDFYNTIIWGNNAAVGPQGYLFEVFAQADFFYCDVEGGPGLFGGSGGGAAFSGAYESCIDQDPDFLGFGELPYSIYVNSPCFNAGSTDTSGFMLPLTDLEYNPRVVLEVIDIGADEVYPFGVEDKISHDEQVRVWPNPFVDHINVEINAEWNEDVMVMVYDLTGRRIYAKNTFFEQKRYSIEIKDQMPGIYLVKISSSHINQVERLVKISR